VDSKAHVDPRAKPSDTMRHRKTRPQRHGA
jgi:hypothetical protein